MSTITFSRNCQVNKGLLFPPARDGIRVNVKHTTWLKKGKISILSSYQSPIILMHHTIYEIIRLHALCLHPSHPNCVLKYTQVSMVDTVMQFGIENKLVMPQTIPIGKGKEKTTFKRGKIKLWFVCVDMKNGILVSPFSTGMGWLFRVLFRPYNKTSVSVCKSEILPWWHVTSRQSVLQNVLGSPNSECAIASSQKTKLACSLTGQK